MDSAPAATRVSTISSPDTRISARLRFAWLRSPLWLCLFLALLVRVWLVIHTRGFIDADEALVGVQAQHILQGERPIYYYGQPYMGSLEAYLLAGIFALVGPSPWALRALPILLSLLLVYLTWGLAGILADAAKLSVPVKRWFMLVAGLLAACPPLYNLVMEMRTWGGHIEIYLLMLALLYAAHRLCRRWDEGAGWREIALRWAEIGLIIGVGLWVYPLIVCAILAMLVWVGVFLAGKLLPLLRTSASVQREALKEHLRKMGLAGYVLPACLLGFAPGIYWGAQNGWANVLYLFAPGSDGGNDPNFLSRHPDRFSLLIGTVQLYGRCLVPEVFGGSLPAQSLVASSVYSFWLLTTLGVANLVVTTGLVGASCIVRHPRLIMFRRLAALPLLFAWCTIFVFCFSSTVGSSMYEPCTRDGVGRYAAPILLALPFTGAALCILVYSLLRPHHQQASRAFAVEEQQRVRVQHPVYRREAKRKLLVLPLVLYLLVIGNTYVQSNPDYVFQSFTCLNAPADNQPIIEYMQQQNIHYAWGTIVLGNSIMFKTNNQIIVADPRILVYRALNRLPQNVQAVAAADRASLLDLVPHAERYPLTLQLLDQANILYRVARFPTQPGNLDVLVITPLNRTLKPSEATSYGSWSMRC